MKSVQKKGKTEVIKDRCKIIAEIVNKLRETYKDSNENQKAFIETIIGAAIWYMPKPKDYWSGYISVKAINGFKGKNKSKLSEEHIIPRKVAAKELLEADKLLTTENVEEKYLSEYCKLHYITPEENKKAIKYQKTNVYTNSYEVYKQAGINLKKINSEILKQLKDGNIEIIDKLLNS
jgi:hypothetical protein